MTNLEKYLNVYMEAFEISADVAKTSQYESVPNWDSVGHMVLCSLLEKSFNIMLEPQDIVALCGFEQGKEILGKYGIIFD